jgi:GNAT superfamily N-acetyltransferase
MIFIKETTLLDIDVMRMEHLRSLPEFQDLFLELQIPHARVVEISQTGNRIGYVIVKGRVMLEFFVIHHFQSDICKHFFEIVKICGVDTILVQSFDRVLMACCSRLYSSHVIGLLYRDFTRLTTPENPDISFRPANQKDLPFLMMHEDGVFEPKDRLPVSLEKGEIIIFLTGETIIGCGFITRIHLQWDYYDLGVWVVPAFRGHGYGTRIISRLTVICDNNGWIPVCGCGVDNLGSQRVLEKNGFKCHYQLLEFNVTAKE